MYHHAAKGIVVGAGTDHLDLSTASFFCWSAHSNDPTIDLMLLNCPSDANHGGQPCRGNEVVAASMADLF